MTENKTYQELSEELKELRIQLEEASDVIEAIRSGEIDALVVKDKEGHQLYTLKNTDQTYRIFIEQMAEGAVTLNEENRILYCNSQFASMTGLPLEKVIGRSFISFFSEKDQLSCADLLSAAWHGNVKAELHMLSASTSVKPVLLSLKTLDLDEGLSMSIIITDLSIQKETQKLLHLKNEQLQEAQEIAEQLNVNLEKKVRERTLELEVSLKEKSIIEESLRNNEERLTLILETMAEGIGIADRNGNLTYSNPMAKKIFGMGANDELKRLYHDPQWTNLRVDGSELPVEEHPVSMVFSNGKPVYDKEIAVKRQDEEPVFISINAAGLKHRNGDIIACVCTFMNVTSRRKSSQQKDEFISVASHELKTPLTTMQASMQILNRLIHTDPHSEKIKHFIEKANINVSKIARLTEDLMNVSKLQHGQLALNKTHFDLNELVKDCTDHIRLAGSHDLIIEDNGSQVVYADPQRIGQVIVNLINNAIKYAPLSKTINLRQEHLCDKVKVSVHDYGIGISADKLPHLFDRYYRVDPSGMQFSGLGLGLYISSEIIERHGGEMGVESIVDQGSSFWFTLPVDGGSV